jgi:uncharacterized iron-regulated membrane protein
MMRALDLLHRWTGGLIGLLLALLGASGTILLWKEAWLRWMLPGAADPRVTDAAVLGDLTAHIMADAPGSILFATDGFGLNRVNFGERGAYIDQAGHVVARWDSVWDRPELWLFDFHHYLFSGETGETVAGIAGLIGLAFVVTGILLWWRTRRTFRFRLLPKRMTRPAIVTHHRDLGIVMAPLLLLSMVTGTMMVFRPVADLVLRPVAAPGTVTASLAPPKIEGGALDRAALDWRRIVPQALARYPGAELRVISMPKKAGDLVSIRLKQPAEWLPNGRTGVWVDPATGKIVATRDALAMPTGARWFNKAYPLHSGKIGGVLYRTVMTLSGLTLAMLGSLAVWSFWTERGRRRRAESRRRRALAIEAA